MTQSKPRLNASKAQRTRAAQISPTAPTTSTGMPRRARRKSHPEGPSLEGLAGVLIAFPIGYLAAESIMNDNRHPLHWVITVVVAALGYLIGHAWYWWKLQH